jgi:hypothetical protein
MEQKELKGIIHSDPEIMGGTPSSWVPAFRYKT